MSGIRRWTSDDRDAVVAFILSIQRGEFGVPITAADQPDIVDVDRHYGDGASGFWVAREHDDVIGTIALLDHGDGGAALRKMFVRADRRGRGFDVADRLFATLIAHAQSRGVRTISLGTRPEMLAAHRFYEKNGFTRIDPAELPPTFPRMKVDSVFYRREL